MFYGQYWSKKYYYTLRQSDFLFFHKVGHEDSVGLYAIALVIVGIMFLVGKNAYSAVEPKISILHKTPQKRIALEVMLKQSTRVGLSIILILFLVIVIFANSILLHFGPLYTRAHDVLIILAVGCLIYSLGAQFPC